MKTAISILGCGWLGFPLAQKLISAGKIIKGSTTSPEKLMTLREGGIEAYEIRLTETAVEGNIKAFLNNVHSLVVNVPPKRASLKAQSYYHKMKHLRQEVVLAGVKNVLFVSSTSVYGDLKGEVSEASVPKPQTESAKQLLQSEQLFKNSDELATTVVRFGGLIGPDRHPVYRLSQKKNIERGDAPVNLIHLNDCVKLLLTVLEKEHWGELFNGVSPEHPSKRLYYTKEAQKRGLPEPKFSVEKSGNNGKIVNCKNFLYKKQEFVTSIWT